MEKFQQNFVYNPSISEMFLIKLLENLFTFRNENIHFTKSYYCQKNIGIEKTEANLISMLLGDKKITLENYWKM